jgi:hypothetical protein
MAHGANEMKKAELNFDSLRIKKDTPAQPLEVPTLAPVSPTAVIPGERGTAASPPKAPTPRPGSEAKPNKTIPVRLTAVQWQEAKQFAIQCETSLQDLFIDGLNAMRAAKGIPPLSGTAK